MQSKGLQARTRTSARYLCGLILFVAIALGACRKESVSDESARDVPSAAPVAEQTATGGATVSDIRATLKATLSEDKVKNILNPKGLAAYDGPTAIVKGRVTVRGDEAPETPIDAQMNCDLARPMFGRLFREGPGRSLADVLVAITEYEGFVPDASSTVRVNAEGCAWETRTVVLTFGQAVEVVAKDRKPYVPELVGQRTVAQLFALPEGDPVHLVPERPGRFVLLDSMRLYNRAQVFVLPYATYDVTGLDGRFEIRGVPAQRVKISAFLPETGGVVEKVLELQAGQSVEVPLEIEFQKTQLENKR